MVDIVIPSFNRKELLKRAVRSVQNQSFKAWKLWILDDGSTDGTAQEFGEKFSSNNGIQVISLETNQGVSRARNKGIEQGCGEWLAFLDSDDEWFPKKLEKQICFAKKNPHYSFIHCNEIWLKNGEILNQKKKHKKQGGRVFIPSVRLCCISPSAVLMKRSLLEELGLFREDFPVCEDYEMWLRVSSGHLVGFIEDVLVKKYGGHGDQLSARYPAMDYWRLKALKPYLKDKNLSHEERGYVRKILIEKGQILLKGYEKHKNFKNKQEVESIIKLCL